jgi:hypothetical protein
VFWLPITTDIATFKLAFVGFTLVHGELGPAHQMNFSNWEGSLCCAQRTNSFLKETRTMAIPFGCDERLVRIPDA